MAIKDVKNQGSKAPASKVRSWVEAFMNPLAGMTKRSIERMLEQKRLGNDAMLQVAYAEVEANMPIFGITIDKRVAGVAGRAWDVVPVDESAAAKAQAEKVKRMFEKADMKNKDGLGRALEHLVLGAFRGRSCVKCFVDGEDLSFKALDNWNVLEKNGRLYWNPDLDVDMDVERLQEIPDGEVAWTSYARPVDQPGIMIYLRQLVGEEQWARFVEKQGIPQVILTPPEGTSDSQQDEWMYRAMRIFEGGSGVIPPGGQVTELTGGRGQDPFTEYVRHQMETISILATGGTLLTLGGSTGLNSNLADVQLA